MTRKRLLRYIRGGVQQRLVGCVVYIFIEEEVQTKSNSKLLSDVVRLNRVRVCMKVR
jgi:hypothetical protein